MGMSPLSSKETWCVDENMKFLRTNHTRKLSKHWDVWISIWNPKIKTVKTQKLGEISTHLFGSDWRFCSKVENVGNVGNVGDPKKILEELGELARKRLHGQRNGTVICRKGSWICQTIFETAARCFSIAKVKIHQIPEREERVNKFKLNSLRCSDVHGFGWCSGFQIVLHDASGLQAQNLVMVFHYGKFEYKGFRKKRGLSIRIDKTKTFQSWKVKGMQSVWVKLSTDTGTNGRLFTLDIFKKNLGRLNENSIVALQTSPSYLVNFYSTFIRRSFNVHSECRHSDKT